MPTDNNTIKEINTILKWINLSTDVKDFYLKVGDVEISLSRNNNSPLFSGNQQTTTPPASVITTTVPVETPIIIKQKETQNTHSVPIMSMDDYQLKDDEVFIKAPMLGTFYASPKPGTPNFVKVGDTVKADTILCIVEVMKLMNNIEAKVEGVITQILVNDEQLIEYGQPLMVVKTK